MHVTFLDPRTGAKTGANPAKKMYGACKGGAIWLGEHATHMLCAEGIEKGLACRAATGIPTAVGLSSTILPSIVWPRATKRVTLCADPNGAGEAAIHKAAKAMAADDIELLVVYPPTPGKDWDETPADAVKAAISAAKPWGAPHQACIDEEAEEQFQRNDDGKIRSNEHNFLLAMRKSKVTFRYDEFSAEGFVDGLEGYGPSISDAVYGEIYLMLPRHHGFKVSREDIRDIVRSQMLRNRFHPVKDYLASLEWDGVERLDEWLCTYAGAKDTPFTRAVGSLTLIAAVRRIRQPGCKFDEMLILESPEGRDKSSAFRLLAGEEHFSDHAPFGASQREVIESLHGRWIVECPDLDTMSRAEVNSMKAFLSRQVDRAAMKYERETTALARHCVFVGTTNEDAYLVSRTGNRRYWPVRIERFDLEALGRDRDHLWAEAAYREAKGESIRLPQELWGEARQEQEQREVGDEVEELVRDWLDDRTNLDGGYRTTIVTVAKGALKLEAAKISSTEQRRVASLLKRAGWSKSSRSNGKNWWTANDDTQNLHLAH
jgi:hypothetical protein